MDILNYYSKSFNGLKKTPKIIVPAFLGFSLIFAIAFITLSLILIKLGPILPIFFEGLNEDPPCIIFSIMLVLWMLLVVVAALVIISIAGLIISSYTSAATIGMSKDMINGAMPGLRVGFENGNKYFLKIILINIFKVLILVILLFLIYLGSLLGLMVDSIVNSYASSLLTASAYLLSLTLWLVAIILSTVVDQSLVVGERSVIGSIRDSAKFSRKNIFELMVVLIINLVITICIMVSLYYILNFLSSISDIGVYLGLILGIISFSIIYSYFTLVITYFYMDKKDIISQKLEHSPELDYVD